MQNDDNRFYVYVFFNKTWNEVFYVGKGTGNRMNDGGRNRHITAILENYPCERYIVADNLDNQSALEVEKSLKETYISMGKPIIDYERRYTSKNQMEGIEAAKKRGVYKGRKPVQIDETKFVLLMNDYYKKKTTLGSIAKELGISRPTLYKHIKELKNAFTV